MKAAVHPMPRSLPTALPATCRSDCRPATPLPSGRAPNPHFPRFQHRCAVLSLPLILLLALLGLLGSSAGLQAQSATDTEQGVQTNGFDFRNDTATDSPFPNDGGDAWNNDTTAENPSGVDTSAQQQDPSDSGLVQDPDEGQVPASALPPGDDGTVYRWLGAGIGPADWNDPDHWYPTGVPGASDTAMFEYSGQRCPVIADRIEVGTLLFDDSLDIDFTVSAKEIYIEKGLQTEWNPYKVQQHKIQVSDQFVMVELDENGQPIGDRSYESSAVLASSDSGSTLELCMDVDPESRDFIGDIWQQEAHYLGFSYGYVDEVGDVAADTHGPLELREVPGWGAVLDYRNQNMYSHYFTFMQFPQGFGDGSRFTNYSLSFWFQLSSLEDQVILDMGGDHSGEANVGGLSVLIDDRKLRAVAYADEVRHEASIYSVARFEAVLPENGDLLTDNWYMATIVFRGEGGPNRHGSLDLYLNHDQADFDSRGENIFSQDLSVQTKRVLVVDQSWCFGAPSGGYAKPYFAFTPNGFTGLLDGLALYPGVKLSYLDVADLYAATVPSLRHQWSFSQNLEDSAPGITTEERVTPLAMHQNLPIDYQIDSWIDRPSAIQLTSSESDPDTSQFLYTQDPIAAETQAYEDYALSLWFKTHAAEPDNQILFNAGDPWNGFALRLKDGMLEAASVANELSYPDTVKRLSVGPYTPGQWHLATLVNDSAAGTLTLSLDDFTSVDQLDYRDTQHPDQPWLVVAGGQPYSLGGSLQDTVFQQWLDQGEPQPEYPFEGALDRVRIHSTAVSLGAIENEYHNNMFAIPDYRFVPFDSEQPSQVGMVDEITGIGSAQNFIVNDNDKDERTLQVEGNALAFYNGYYLDVGLSQAGAYKLTQPMEALTVNIWFKPPSEPLTGLQYLYVHGSASSSEVSDAVTLRLHDGRLEGGVRLSVWRNTFVGTWVADDEQDPVEPDSWHLATLVFDGLNDQLLLYLDGELIGASEYDHGSRIPAIHIGDTSGTVTIGAPIFRIYTNDLNSMGLHGFRLRSVEIFTGLALNPDRIRSIYNVPFPDNQWSFEGNPDDSLSDLEGTELGAPIYTDSNWIDGARSLQLDGTSGIDYGYNPLDLRMEASRRSYSWSLWVRPEVMEATTFRTLLQNTFDSPDATVPEFQQMELLQLGNEIEFSVARAPEDDPSSSLLTMDRITAELQPDAWNHIVAVFDAERDGNLATADEVKLELYVNGVLTDNAQSSAVVDLGDRESQPLNLQLGLPQYEDRLRRDSGSGAMLGFEGLQGLIDDVRFFQQTLDADDVSVLYDFYNH